MPVLILWSGPLFLLNSLYIVHQNVKDEKKDCFGHG